ncbi:MAG: hypothetical protein FWG64_12750 [Firmicutes bacterium]|nr:hypothetical protein [Bacillota bacterium]
MQQKTYNLFGKQYTPNEGLQMYHEIIYDFLLDKAIDAEEAFTVQYARFTDIEQVLTQSESLYLAIMKQFLEDLSDKLYDMDIPDYDAEQLWQMYNQQNADDLAFPKRLAEIRQYYELEYGALNGENTSVQQGGSNMGLQNSFTSAQNSLVSNSNLITPLLNTKQAAGAATKASKFAKGAAVTAMTAVKAHPYIAIGSALGVAVVGGAVAYKKKREKAAIEKGKAAMFNDSQIPELLGDAISDDCYGLDSLLIKIMQKHGKTILDITPQIKQQAERLFRKLHKNTPREEAVDTMIEIFQLNPYEQKYYEYLIENFFDEKNEVENIADNFGHLSTVREFKFGLAEQAFHKSPKSNIAETLQTAEHLQELCAAINIDAENFLVALSSHIVILVENYFLQLAESTTKITTESTETERLSMVASAANRLQNFEHCKQTLAKLEEYCQPFWQVPEILIAAVEEKLQSCKVQSAADFLETWLTTAGQSINEETLLEIENKLLDYCNKIGFTADSAGENPVWLQLDKLIRTVMGIEFATREQARTAREEKAYIDEIRSQNGHHFRGDFVAILHELENAGFTTEIKTLYKAKYSDYLTEFDKKWKKAKHYEEMQKPENKPKGLFGSLSRAVSGAISWAVDEEGAYNELTQNGQYTLEQVNSSAVSNGVAPPQIMQVFSNLVESHIFFTTHELQKISKNAAKTMVNVENIAKETLPTVVNVTNFSAETETLYNSPNSPNLPSSNNNPASTMGFASDSLGNSNAMVKGATDFTKSISSKISETAAAVISNTDAIETTVDIATKISSTMDKANLGFSQVASKLAADALDNPMETVNNVLGVATGKKMVSEIADNMLDDVAEKEKNKPKVTPLSADLLDALDVIKKFNASNKN